MPGSTSLPPIEATGAATSSSLTERPVVIGGTSGQSLRHRAAELTARANWVGLDASALHRDALREELSSGARPHAKRSVQDMLADLSREGFSWRDIARLAGVTVPAVQKWRRGEGASPDRVIKLATMCSVLDMLRPEVDELASWFEIRLRTDVALTCLDLAAGGRHDLVLQWGTSAHAVAPEEIFEQFDPEWRHTRVDEQFEVFVAPDGVAAIRPKSRT